MNNKDRFTGVWELIPEKSSDIDLFRKVSVKIDEDDKNYTFSFTWGGHRSVSESYSVPKNGTVVTIPVEHRVLPANVFMGAALEPGEEKRVSAVSGEGVLELKASYRVRGSQGHKDVLEINTFSGTKEEDIIRWT
ncbi:MAG: hypothetical protein ACLFST_14780, partial [Spirochaetia bacterium]